MLNLVRRVAKIFLTGYPNNSLDCQHFLMLSIFWSLLLLLWRYIFLKINFVIVKLKWIYESCKTKLPCDAFLGQISRCSQSSWSMLWWNFACLWSRHGVSITLLISHNPIKCFCVHIVALTLFLLGEQEFERFAGTCFSYCCWTSEAIWRYSW